MIAHRPLACIVALAIATAASFGCADTRWTRVVEHSPSWSQVESATGTFRDAGGREVRLLAEIHFGEPAYWDAMLRECDGAEVVLLEGVRGLERVPGLEEQSQRSAGASGLIHGGFAWKQRLSNAISADVDLQTLHALSAAEGGATGADLEEYVIEGTAVTRAVMIEAIRSGPARMSPTRRAIVERRNEAALAVLDAKLAAGRKCIAIVYGAGHAPGLARGLEARGFARQGELRWRTAFAGQACLHRSDYSRTGQSVPRHHSLWVQSGGEVAEIQFGSINDRDWYGPRGSLLLYDGDGKLREETSLRGGLEDELPIRIPFRDGRELFLGWEEGESGALVIRHDPPPALVEPYRYAGPARLPADRRKRLALPTDLRWRAEP